MTVQTINISARAPSLVEQLLRSVDQCQSLGDAGEVKQTLYLRRASNEPKSPPLVDRPLVGLDEDAQARRIHELELSQIEHHELDTAGQDARKLILEPRTRGEVQLPADNDQCRTTLAADFYPELAIHATSERTDLGASLLTRTPDHDADVGLEAAGRR